MSSELLTREQIFYVLTSGSVLMGIKFQLESLLPEVRLVCLWQTVARHPQGLKPFVGVRHTKAEHTHTHRKNNIIGHCTGIKIHKQEFAHCLGCVFKASEHTLGVFHRI